MSRVRHRSSEVAEVAFEQMYNDDGTSVLVHCDGGVRAWDTSLIVPIDYDERLCARCFRKKDGSRPDYPELCRRCVGYVPAVGRGPSGDVTWHLRNGICELCQSDVDGPLYVFRPVGALPLAACALCLALDMVTHTLHELLRKAGLE